MCLSTVWPKKKQKEWLKKQKSPLVLYGPARQHQVSGNKYSGVFHGGFYNAGVNVSVREKAISAYSGDSYIPHYHRFANPRDARVYLPLYPTLKWRCYKKDVTDIGTQEIADKHRIVVIARRLTLAGLCTCESEE